MTKSTINILLESKQRAEAELAKLSKQDRATLEKSWDVEHAYYSSSLEGSKIDRKEFDKLAKDIK